MRRLCPQFEKPKNLVAVPLWSFRSLVTSRERPKLAPYLRLKNSKRTSKCQSILFYGTGKTQKLNRIGAPEGTLWDFSSILSQIKKLKEGHFWWKKNFLKKSLTMPKKLKGGTLWIFQHPFCRKTLKKLRGGTLWGNFFFEKKVSQRRKYSKAVPFGPFEFLRWCKNTTSQAFAPVF